jgi:hypothetical protein
VDTDCESWPTPHFVRTDIYVKEGLAQYYTEQIMRTVRDRKVAEALVNQLASRVEVFHGFHWLGAGRARNAR